MLLLEAYLLALNGRYLRSREVYLSSSITYLRSQFEYLLSCALYLRKGKSFHYFYSFTPSTSIEDNNDYKFVFSYIDLI